MSRQAIEGAAFYPFSFKPERTVSVRDIIAFQRSAFEGTVYDMTADPAWIVPDGQGGGRRSVLATPFPSADLRELLRVASHRTIAQHGYGMVAQLRGWLPNPIGGVLWFYVDNPYVSTYVPVYAGVTSTSALYQTYDARQFSEGSARWAVDFVDNLMHLKWQAAVKDLRAVRDPIEQEFFDTQAEVERRALDLHRRRRPRRPAFPDGPDEDADGARRGDVPRPARDVDHESTRTAATDAGRPSHDDARGAFTIVDVACPRLRDGPLPAACHPRRRGCLNRAALDMPAQLVPVALTFDDVRRDAMIPMRDGVKLHTVVLVPRARRARPSCSPARPITPPRSRATPTARTSARSFRQEIPRLFLDQHLKAGAPRADIAPVSAFETGTNTWRRLNAWPSGCASGCAVEAKPLYLNSGLKLSFAEPKPGGAG